MLGIHHFFQIDLPPCDSVQPDCSPRFWMDSCGGRDQVVRQVHAQDWTAYEPPLPSLLHAWCTRLQPVFLDIGANTGFYALLAAAAGARHVHAFEPVIEIAQVLQANARISELQQLISLHGCALGEQSGTTTLFFPLADHGLVETSASMNPKFRAQHAEQREVPMRTLDAMCQSGLAGLSNSDNGMPLLIKIDVETAESSVLCGAQQTLGQHRPALVCEILPGSDMDYWPHMMQTFGYAHYETSPNTPWLSATELITPDLKRRDHVFLPQENIDLWLQPLSL